MSGDVDLHGLARALHRRYDWTQKHWRRLVADHGFPAPFIGGEPHSKPWWNGDLVERWKAGDRFGADWRGTGGETQPTPPMDPANDGAPTPPTPRADRLLASLG